MEQQPSTILSSHKPITKKEGRKKKTRRGARKRTQNTEKLIITGTNANGLKPKKESLNSLLETDRPQVFMIQETKTKRKNEIQIQGYELFEKPRKGKDGGGIMIGVRKDIESTPVIVSNCDDGDEVEVLTVEIALKQITIRFLTAYVPQEGAGEDKINKFYATLEEEIMKCEQEGCGLVAEFDCNAKLGSEIIEGDPNNMSANGKIFWDLLERRECTVVNMSEECSGTITRSRMKQNKLEESVLDYVIVNPIVAPYIASMEIDETKSKALTRFKKGIAITSDHNVLTVEIGIIVSKLN